MVDVQSSDGSFFVNHTCSFSFNPFETGIMLEHEADIAMPATYCYRPHHLATARLGWWPRGMLGLALYVRRHADGRVAHFGSFPHDLADLDDCDADVYEDAPPATAGAEQEVDESDPTVPFVSQLYSVQSAAASPWVQRTHEKQRQAGERMHLLTDVLGVRTRADRARGPGFWTLRGLGHELCWEGPAHSDDPYDVTPFSLDDMAAMLRGVALEWV